MKISNQVSVKGDDLTKTVTELRHFKGAEHLDLHIYISGLCFYDSV